MEQSSSSLTIPGIPSVSMELMKVCAQKGIHLEVDATSVPVELRGKSKEEIQQHLLKGWPWKKEVHLRFSKRIQSQVEALFVLCKVCGCAVSFLPREILFEIAQWITFE